jgi:hypothetical protein
MMIHNHVRATRVKMARKELLLALALLAAGCQQNIMPSMTAVPPEWRDKHPWGPQANALRDQGLLSTCRPNLEMQAWLEWGKAHIQDGDILLRRGLASNLKDKVINHILVTATDSAFTHDAIAHWHNGKIWIYDAEAEGVRHMPFEIWMLDVVPHKLALERPKPEFQKCVPQALAFCEEKYQQEVPFDKDLNLDDEKLYCTELIEKAYRSAGMIISQPVPLRCQPQFHRYAILGPLGERTTGLRRAMPLFSVGNCHHGVLSSPNLDLIYMDELADTKHKRKSPTCDPVPYP